MYALCVDLTEEYLNDNVQFTCTYHFEILINIFVCVLCVCCVSISLNVYGATQMEYFEAFMVSLNNVEYIFVYYSTYSAQEYIPIMVENYLVFNF